MLTHRKLTMRILHMQMHLTSGFFSDFDFATSEFQPHKCYPNWT